MHKRRTISPIQDKQSLKRFSLPSAACTSGVPHEKS
jgi:hypothetical protein